MPTLLRRDGWRFVFYSVDLAEPPHVHAWKGRQEVKIWLRDVTLARAKRCAERDIADLLRIAGEHRIAFLEAWHAHGGDRP